MMPIMLGTGLLFNEQPLLTRLLAGVAGRTYIAARKKPPQGALDSIR
jgi:hypothetical protein